jgi:hypothetical protein
LDSFQLRPRLLNCPLDVYGIAGFPFNLFY